ncbi:N-hydroxyarylamine O-acetyltransferase [Actinorhabdospora filicis]|uniref:N-hydroxyarylamine O-acetyltransferase n=1 Tax=Actinorhabdospora filicis TaxID=1785913 RepID=A0A9W6SSB2_9ACTN|nr:arylamine N-acetyltransferase [Actinorhabdospora filicis]GLZ82000.1 N-hydroxyarylamine O-acetyltransferase [Actinorhabdospora filicis]
MDAATADRYLARIGADRPEVPDLDALRALQSAHLRSVPFENLSIHLGEPIELDEDSLVGKIVDGGRGGFCYELNGLFADLLEHLGYHVARLQAMPGLVPFDHLTLMVEIDEPLLVDVGFGRFAHEPLRLESRGKQQDPDGIYTVEEVEYGDLLVRREGEKEFVVDLRPRELDAFVPTCWWHQTSPKSHFTRSPVCSLVVPDGRVTLRGRKLITTVGDEKREEIITDDAEVLGVYREIFGIELDRLPGE